MVRATPRTTIIMPSVAMNGGSFSLVMSRPLAAPQAAPVSRPMNMLIQIGTPAIAAMTATVPVSAMTDPMERSMPAVMMVKVTPMPMMVVVLVCRARLRMLRMVKKFFAVMEKTVNRTTTAPKVRNLSSATPDLPFAVRASGPCSGEGWVRALLMIEFSLSHRALPRNSGFPPAWFPS